MGCSPICPAFDRRKMLPVTNMHKIALCISILIYFFLFIKRLTWLVSFMFISNLWILQGINWPLKGKKTFFGHKEFFAFVPIVCVGYFPSVFFVRWNVFCFFSKTDSWQKGHLSGKKQTKTKKAATHDLYYPFLKKTVKYKTREGVFPSFVRLCRTDQWFCNTSFQEKAKKFSHTIKSS